VCLVHVTPIMKCVWQMSIVHSLMYIARLETQIIWSCQPNLNVDLQNRVEYISNAIMLLNCSMR